MSNGNLRGIAHEIWDVPIYEEFLALAAYASD